MILIGDVRERLKELPDQSVNCCVTSPPYWGLRDYGTASWEGGLTECEHNPQKADGGARADRTLPLGRGGVYKDICGDCGAIRVDDQIGLESTPQEFVDSLVAVFREVKRVLRDDGTLWVNMGDTYSSHKDCKSTAQTLAKGGSSEMATVIEKGKSVSRDSRMLKSVGLKNKDLVGIPWMLAFALRADGWYLRQDIIWAKPNPMPESVTDRCTKSHEYIFLLSKSARYYYDNEAIKEPSANLGKTAIKFGGNKYGDSDDPKHATKSGNEYTDAGTRNKRDVWTVSTRSYKGAHFATFPPALIEPCILAGSPEGGTVLDPFFGAGTTGLVAQRHGRQWIGCELNPEYAALAQTRIEAEANLFTSSD